MKQAMRRRKFLARGAFGSLGAFLAGYPFFIERYLFQVNTYTIPVANLPVEFNGFTIVQLTDLHYGFLMPLFAIRYIVRKANALRKDLIVCTGDYFHERNSTRQIDTIWPELNRLSAENGVYSVLGNHDPWRNFQSSLKSIINREIYSREATRR
jgi:predicted MPP superfamily phosphohydrolase